MLSQFRKFGLHLVLANQSIAQLPEGLQKALGNAQTIISFRASRADAEILSRDLGQVDVEAIKRESQTDIQHPVFSPIYEQREGFIQTLTQLSVRQFMVKTADDRLALLWAEKLPPPSTSTDQLEALIQETSKRHGAPIPSMQSVGNDRNPRKKETPLFTR